MGRLCLEGARPSDHPQPVTGIQLASRTLSERVSCPPSSEDERTSTLDANSLRTAVVQVANPIHGRSSFLPI